MSAKGDLLDALAAYAKALQGTPGVEDVSSSVAELTTLVQSKPDPTPSSQPPPFHGQQTSGGVQSNGTSPNWPKKGEVVIRISGA